MRDTDKHRELAAERSRQTDYEKRNYPLTYLLAAADVPGWLSSSPLSELKSDSCKSSEDSLLLEKSRKSTEDWFESRDLRRLAARVEVASAAIFRGNYAEFRFSRRSLKIATWLKKYELYSK